MCKIQIKFASRASSALGLALESLWARRLGYQGRTRLSTFVVFYALRTGFARVFHCFSRFPRIFQNLFSRSWCSRVLPGFSRGLLNFCRDFPGCSTVFWDAQKGSPRIFWGSIAEALRFAGFPQSPFAGFAWV